MVLQEFDIHALGRLVTMATRLLDSVSVVLTGLVVVCVVLALCHLVPPTVFLPSLARLLLDLPLGPSPLSVGTFVLSSPLVHLREKANKLPFQEGSDKTLPFDYKNPNFEYPFFRETERRRRAVSQTLSRQKRSLA